MPDPWPGPGTMPTTISATCGSSLSPLRWRIGLRWVQLGIHLDDPYLRTSTKWRVQQPLTKARREVRRSSPWCADHQSASGHRASNCGRWSRPWRRLPAGLDIAFKVTGATQPSVRGSLVDYSRSQMQRGCVITSILDANVAFRRQPNLVEAPLTDLQQNICSGLPLQD
jgi:hypothetical protein